MVDKIFAKIELLKDEHGYSDKDIAEGIGYSPSGYYRLKNKDRQLSIEHIEKLANFFEMPFHELCFDSEDLAAAQLSKEELNKLLKLTLEGIGISETGINSIFTYLNSEKL